MSRHDYAADRPIILNFLADHAYEIPHVSHFTPVLLNALYDALGWSNQVWGVDEAVQKRRLMDWMKRNVAGDAAEARRVPGRLIAESMALRQTAAAACTPRPHLREAPPRLQSPDLYMTTAIPFDAHPAPPPPPPPPPSARQTTPSRLPIPTRPSPHFLRSQVPANLRTAASTRPSTARAHSLINPPQAPPPPPRAPRIRLNRATPPALSSSSSAAVTAAEPPPPHAALAKRLCQAQLSLLDDASGGLDDVLEALREVIRGLRVYRAQRQERGGGGGGGGGEDGDEAGEVGGGDDGEGEDEDEGGYDVEDGMYVSAGEEEM